MSSHSILFTASKIAFASPVPAVVADSLDDAQHVFKVTLNDSRGFIIMDYLRLFQYD